jgi:hypothetical protein
MNRNDLRALIMGLMLCFATDVSAQSSGGVQFLTFQEAAPVVHAMEAHLPPALTASLPLSAETWTNWVHEEDASIRARLDRGQEDTLTNLLRFGVTFTKEYRIDDAYLLKFGQSSLVNAFAENRANDLIHAMATGTPNEGIEQMRVFLEKKGYSFKTPEDRKRVKLYLLANLARMRDELIRYTSRVQEGNRDQLFEDRGISLDTNLWPDFLIDQHLQNMLKKGLLQPGSVHRVAIVGPGLDFANKEKGNDFYPPQTIQPFAVLDSLIRMGLAAPGAIEIYTLDISPEIKFHIERSKKNAAAGHAYVVQLPWNSSARLSPEYRQAFVEYWRKIGESIGQSVPPINVPAGAAAETQTRAVRIRPEIVQCITPLDTNIVFQHLVLASDKQFDLIIGTNIFVYFNAFEQALARKNMALMLKPGGFVFSNDSLPGTLADGLSDSVKTTQTVASAPDRIEYMFSYELKK